MWFLLVCLPGVVMCEQFQELKFATEKRCYTAMSVVASDTGYVLAKDENALSPQFKIQQLPENAIAYAMCVKQ